MFSLIFFLLSASLAFIFSASWFTRALRDRSWRFWLSSRRAAARRSSVVMASVGSTSSVLPKMSSVAARDGLALSSAMLTASRYGRAPSARAG